MNISTKLDDEQIDPKKPSGGYEWWYFDALSIDKEWGFVVIFYEGNPFSPNYIQSEVGIKPSDYPAISVSLYKRDKTEFYSFLEFGKDSFNWEKEPLTGAVGSSFFKREERDLEIHYELILNQVLDSGHHINASLNFKGKKMADLVEGLSESDESGKHFWNLLLPEAKVQGSVEIKGKADNHSIRFNGKGYHDHNKGLEPMKDSFEDWYWGRFHFPEHTLVYYYMNGLEFPQHKAWLFDKNGMLIETPSEIELDHYSKTMFGLKSARKIVLNGDSTEITIQQRDMVDNGPFYQRFISDGLFRYNDGLHVAQGITEYFKPENIYNERYWWMVKMRIRFMSGNAHWVQRFKNLYEWTW